MKLGPGSFVRDGRVWRYVASDVPRPTVLRWFGHQFDLSAQAIVSRWAPRWARVRVGPRALGWWLLAMLWIVLPSTLALVLLR